mmetsp:Transcript_23505/g.39890  ORF Transcript_23505/g.39890 Transcript_23505/m.39890 type:complete len:104 (+) Transcript_23505:74-385(+)
MVCDSCQVRLSKLAVPDVVKKKDPNNGNNTVAGGGVRAGKTNKALMRKKASEVWLPSKRACRICKSKIMAQMNYCNDCAHKKGICTMCGRKSVDTSGHKMSLT